MNTSHLALEAIDLEKRYGTVQALDKVCLNVASGACVALLGPNGAGKTTLCEILEGLIPADSGRVNVFGLDLQKNLTRIRQWVGVQLQETILYRRYTVEETLRLFASFYSKSWPIAPLIERLGLKAQASRRLDQLSGGQRQRVYLGSCLINRPKLVFLDEPTTGLDPATRRMLWELLKELQASEGLTMLLTTHAMEEAQALADKVAIIDHGRIIAEGTSDGLIETHAPGGRLRFKTDPSTLPTWKKHLPWLEKAVSQQDGRVAMHVENPTAAGKDLILLASQHNLPLQELELARASLEDVFLNLTGRSIRDDG